jgi:hypothetical protein
VLDGLLLWSLDEPLDSPLSEPLDSLDSLEPSLLDGLLLDSPDSELADGLLLPLESESLDSLEDFELGLLDRLLSDSLLGLLESLDGLPLDSLLSGLLDSPDELPLYQLDPLLSERTLSKLDISLELSPELLGSLLDSLDGLLDLLDGLLLPELGLSLEPLDRPLLGAELDASDPPLLPDSQSQQPAECPADQSPVCFCSWPFTIEIEMVRV